MTTFVLIHGAYQGGWIWQPVVMRGQSVALRHLLNGWALSSITTVASGHPVTPLVLVSGQQFSGITMQYTTSLDGSGGWNRAACSGAIGASSSPWPPLVQESLSPSPSRR